MKSQKALTLMMKSDFHGLILVDKPSGISSHDVVSKLRKIFKTKGVGHTGTLDPMASGLMACLLNEGTKLSQYILEGDKAYRVRAQFGLTTDTLDTTGTVLSESATDFDEQLVVAKAKELEGTFDFIPPIYSAIKIQGKKLYEYAREGEEVEIPTKEMRFYDVQFLGSGIENGKLWADFDLHCSKGSYIRTWVDQLGKKLGSGAAMSQLRRTFSSPYFVTQASTLEEIEAHVFSGNEPKGLIPLADSLPGAHKIKVQGQDEVMLKNGQISHALRSELIRRHQLGQPVAMSLVFSQGSERVLALIGFDSVKGFVLRRVFHYPA